MIEIQYQLIQQIMNENCLELDSEILSSGSNYEQQMEKSEEAIIVNKFKTFLVRKTDLNTSSKFNPSQLNRQKNIISNKQLQLQIQVRNKLQQEKLNAFKNKIKNDQFIKKQVQYAKVHLFNVPKIDTKQQINEKRINIQEIQNKQVRPTILSKLGNFQQNGKNQQKIKKQQIKTIIKELTSRNEDKPKIYMFNETGQRLQSGYKYYLQSKPHKKQKNKSKKEFFRRSQQQKYDSVGKLVDFDSGDEKQINNKNTQRQVKPKRKSLFPSFKLKQENKEENEQLKLTETEKQMMQKIQDQEAIISYVPLKLRKHLLKELIRPIEEPQSHAFVRKILKHQFDALNNKIKSSNLQIAGSYQRTEDYAFVMSNLLINQCLCDIEARIRKIVEKKMKPFSIQIQQIEQNSKGQIQMGLKLIQSEDEVRQSGKQFKQLSQFGYRIGILTNCSQITLLSNYGVPSKNNKKVFAVLCYVQMGKGQRSQEDKLKVIGQFEKAQIQLILLQQKSKEAWFYDLDRISSSFREYIAISNLQYSELASLLTNPKSLLFFKPQLLPAQTIKTLDPLLKDMKSKYNQAQFEAIKQISQSEAGIFLLQGPPGTGKTTALMGLIATHFQLLLRSNQQLKVDHKILICAPSNTAIDYIVKKLKIQGILGAQGKQIFPKIVRTGAIESTDQIIKQTTMDYLCEQQIKRLAKIDELNAASLNSKIVQLSKALEKEKDNAKLKQELREAQAKLTASSNESKSQSKRDKKQIQQKILRQSQIILTTLNSSGSQRLESIRDKISVVIVDEAAQATQPSILIPLQTGSIKLILVGDPKQLPATVLSNDAEATHYNRSLFERLVSQGKVAYFLNIQYRMDSLIRAFPSRRFYQDRLVDGENVRERARDLTLVPACLREFMGKNLLFINVEYGQQKSQSNSYCNVDESEVVGKVLKRFLQSQQASIGVITPYQAQKKRIDNLIGNSILMVNTVDSFQGQEKDIIIVSTVRANTRGAVGFLDDDRRTNVTLTRSKHLLIVVGHAKTLATSSSWRAFIQFCHEEKFVYQISEKERMNEQVDRILAGQQENHLMFNMQEIMKNIKTKFTLKHHKQVKKRSNTKQKSKLEKQKQKQK